MRKVKYGNKMRNFFSNTGYFFKETFLMIRLSLTSNILSFLSTSLIFFILAMVVAGWWISSGVTRAIQGEAEISAYFGKTVDQNGALELVDSIKGIRGVKNARLVDEKEALADMRNILGKESEILKVFDENPFTSYIEVNIELDSVDGILKELSSLPGIESVRDNRDVLDRIKSLSNLFMYIGWLVLAAAAITTLVIISHIIRLAIQDNREQINTLKLLGAPGSFISFPFVLQGFLMTLGGGIAASLLAAFVLGQIYDRISGPLPFIPLPPAGSITNALFTVIITASAALGIVGSMLGLPSSESR
ncbi:MAG TPA: permease-like cell division protein FtsX [Clostridia bacterium]|nr:permease-like cell division protein FtsX [Clostridia bacterium]